MNTRAILVPAISIMILFSAAAPAGAAWPTEGILVCSAGGHQYYPLAVPDGAGGMIIVWQDESIGNYIYAQRLDGSGNPMWADGGIDIFPGYTGYLRDVVTDDAGGAIVIWDNSTIRELSATRIGPDGTLPWGAAGAIIHTSGDPYNVVSSADGSGGVLVAWSINISGIFNPYAQRLDAGGTELWTADGIPYSSVDLPSDYTPDIVSDGAGGVLIAFMSDDPALPHVYVQRIYANETLWSNSGTRADYTTGMEYASYYPRVTLDGAGGAYVAWQREDYGLIIQAQKMDAAGTRVFASAVALSYASGDHRNPDIISDGVGGACIVWENNRDYGFDIYAQRLDAFGHKLWALDGIPVCAAEFDQYSAVAVSAGPQDFIIGWTGDPTGGHGSGNPLCAQKIDFGGAAQWQVDGVKALEGTAADGYEFIADGSGGLMAVISFDAQLGSDRDIYAQSINVFGSPAAPEPVIMSVTDVPGDQGGSVRITIGSSDRDRLDQDAEQVSSYDVWQRIDGQVMLSGAIAVKEQAYLSGAAGDADGLTLYTDGSRRFITALPGGVFPAGTWELVGSFGASQSDEYIYRASTLADSAGTSHNYSIYTVAAMTTNPSVWFVSAPDSGYSVDNLAPDPPLALAGEQSFTPGGLQLTWDPNTENDLWYYAVYRGTGSLPVPSMAELMATPQAAGYFDGSWTWDSGYWYLVSAVDIHGNESGHTVLTQYQITGEDPMPVPDATFLAQNYPNPFNPITNIAFAIKESGHVSLRIYDAAGRSVATLVDESRPAGSYSTEWNGCGADGTRAASGVYFYRLTAGDFEKTRKMILLR